MGPQSQEGLQPSAASGPATLGEAWFPYLLISQGWELEHPTPGTQCLGCPWTPGSLVKLDRTEASSSQTHLCISHKII